MEGLEYARWPRDKYAAVSNGDDRFSPGRPFRQRVETTRDNNITSLLDSIGSYDYYYYQGSQSEPPCLENTFRMVMSSPLVVTSQQWDSLMDQVLVGYQ